MAKFILSAFADEAGKSLASQIAALQRNGIGYIEPRAIDKKGVITLSECELKEVRRTLDDGGIRVSSLGSPIGKYPIDEPFAPHLEDFRRALQAAHILGTNLIRMFSFFVPQDRLKECRSEVMDRLSVMLEEAKAEGITLCHENESKIYGQMPGEVADLLTTLPDLAGIFDPANYRMNGADAAEGIDVTLPSFRYMHVKDAIFDEQAIVPAGEGEGKIADAIGKIDRHTDHAVFLSVEPHLHVFSAYSSIDDHELKGRHVFKNSDESFDFAVNALKNLLRQEGYTENGPFWVK